MNRDMIHLSRKDGDKLIESLEREASPNSALLAAKRDHDDLISTDEGIAGRGAA